MQLKTSKSFKPLIGFARSQIHSFIFSGLIFTVVMVAISFATGSNPLFGYEVQDISYIDTKTMNFAIVLAAAAFLFAAYTFKPFMFRNECDTFLSLPIRKTSLFALQTIFGLFCILLSCLISFCMFYPAMNLNRFADLSVYATAVKSTFCEIILPACFYYLLAVTLIAKTKNFLSGASLFAAFCLFSFFISKYIVANIGIDAMGVDLYEINAANQTFYFNAGILMPTKIVLLLLRLVFSLGSSVVAPAVLQTIVQICLIVLVFAIFLLSLKTVNLGDFARPFMPKPFLKVLPFAILLMVIPFLLESSALFVLLILAGVLAVISAVLLLLFIKQKKRAIPLFAGLLVLFLIPSFIPLTNAPYSAKLTYEMPDIEDIECVYFDALQPMSMENYDYSLSVNRYQFTSPDAIEKILHLHETIVDNMKKFDLMGTESVGIDSPIAVASGGCEIFNVDEYADYIYSLEDGEEEETEVFEEKHRRDFYVNGEFDVEAYEAYKQAEEEYQIEQENAGEWGLFQTEDISDNYWMYISDLGLSIEKKTVNDLNVYGNDDYSGDIVEIPSYVARFYYQLKDGRFFCRIYTPLPVSWIETDMQAIMQTDEYLSKEQESAGDFYE